LSVVETDTVRSQRSSAAAVRALSGDATAKFPPIPMNARARPSCIARIAATTSVPGARGGAKSNSRASASRKAVLGFSVIPTVRSPCTFECPHRARTCPRHADVAAQQQQVDDLLHVRDAVAVLRDAHRPARDHPLRAHVDLGGVAHPRPRDAAARLERRFQSRCAIAAR
jgi:hypothetical protein